MHRRYSIASQEITSPAATMGAPDGRRDRFAGYLADRLAKMHGMFGRELRCARDDRHAWQRRRGRSGESRAAATIRQDAVERRVTRTMSASVVPGVSRKSTCCSVAISG